VLVAVITPLSQYLTLRTVNADIETAAPVAWAVGLIISLVLVLLPIRLIAGIKRIPRPHLVVLYAMLTVAVPVMNLGLVRQVFMAMFAVPSVFMIDGNNTYRTVYAASDPDWFPVVPTRQGLAWNQSKRLLELLEDRPAIDARAAARQQLLGLVAQQTHRLVAEDATPDPDVRRRLIDRLGQLGAAELESAFATIKGDDDALRVLATYELIDEPGQAPSGDYAAAIDAAQRRSEAAAEALIEQLPDTSELAVSLLAISDDPAAEGFVTDVHDPRLSKSAKAWIEEDLITLPTDWRRRVEAQRDALLKPQNDGRPLWKHLRERVTALTPSDRAKVGRALIEHRELAVSKLDDPQFMRARLSFMYRLARAERQALIEQGREPGVPNQNLAAFIDGIGYTPDRKAELAQRPITDRLEAAHAQVPWNIWRAPMLHWGAVFLLIFLMLMALAELLRRKWVERENLAFPLVEVADYILRHDAALETAEDLRDPPRRPTPLNLLLVAGIALGFLYLSLDAMWHYGFIAQDMAVTFDVSGELLTTGLLQKMNKVFFVLSPIVLGLAFLMSLNLSFSIWSLFFIYTLSTALIEFAYGRGISDSLYTGWAGGRQYPFPMEQLIGATVCFTGILMWKLLRLRKPAGGEAGLTDAEPPAPFVPTPLMILGLTAVPLAIAVLLYRAGVAHVGLLALAAVITLSQAIASARVRAESGLHTHHVSYEFAKLPVVLGLTAITGAAVFGMYAIIAFIPMLLIWRLLPQNLENIELARRHKLAYPVIALGSLGAFIVAVGVGGVAFIHFAYLWGGPFFGEGAATNPTSFNIARYALWSSHFLGEASLDQRDQVHTVRIVAMAAGFAVFAGLTFLRGRFLRFPFHPMGYLIVLLSIFYTWVSPYARGEGGPYASKESSWLWGSVLLAWAIKWLMIKYGGMNTYKKTKPLFIGLIVGAVACVFAWNMFDLGVALLAEHIDFERYGFLKNFTEEGLAPYSPRFY